MAQMNRKLMTYTGATYLLNWWLHNAPEFTVEYEGVVYQPNNFRLIDHERQQVRVIWENNMPAGTVDTMSIAEILGERAGDKKVVGDILPILRRISKKWDFETPIPFDATLVAKRVEIPLEDLDKEDLFYFQAIELFGLRTTPNNRATNGKKLDEFITAAMSFIAHKYSGHAIVREWDVVSSNHAVLTDLLQRVMSHTEKSPKGMNISFGWSNRPRYSFSDYVMTWGSIRMKTELQNVMVWTCSDREDVTKAFHGATPFEFVTGWRIPLTYERRGDVSIVAWLLSWVVESYNHNVLLLSDKEEDVAGVLEYENTVIRNYDASLQGEGQDD